MATKGTGTYKFKAEVSQLLDILTHSLYTHRDVYIRELISNAVDALDKARLKEVMNESVCDSDLDLEIRIDLDKENRTFTISDTGIGMTREELMGNIGTIARSGTSEFIKMISKEKEQDVNLIGKFGVGFYSVFMAGEKVEVTSKSAQEDEPAFTWTSDGRNDYKIKPADESTQRGTTIKVHLREDADNFAEEYAVKTAIEKYSNFVPFPIKLNGEQVNNITAIWREPKSSVKEKDYNDFFKFIAKQGDDPHSWLHFSADVPLQFHALLFVPKTNFEMLGFSREDDGVNLFVKRVLIDSHAKDILPPYLRFARGVIESDDLPLNISRETLQENPYLFKIKNTVVGKFLSFLLDMAENDTEKYDEFWKTHGRILKEGYNDFSQKDKIADLFRFNTSKCEGSEEIPLKHYVDRMHEKQTEIYYLSGASREMLEKHPTMDIFNAKGIEVIFCYDPIDEFVLPGLLTYQEKTFISADQADLSKLDEIPNIESDAHQEKEITEESKKSLDKLARRMKDILGKRVEDVKLSSRLVDSPAMLVSATPGMSSQMEKIMQMMNKDARPAAKVLEINEKHPLILNMLKLYESDAKDSHLTQLTENLFFSLQILEGQVDNPQDAVQGIQKLLQEAANLYVN